MEARKLRMQEAKAIEELLPQLEEFELEDKVSVEDQERLDQENQIKQIARQKPDEVAALIKNWHKDTAGIIANYEEFFSQLSNVKDVYVLGHSMSEVDLPYFEKIKQNIPLSAKWHISVFSEVDINNKQQVVDRLGLANAGFIRMESLSLNREGDLF